MNILYQLIITLSQGILPLAAIFSPKINLFLRGRKHVFSLLKQGLNPHKKTIWLHAASLGEYEQGVPVLESLRSTYPQHQVLLTFFSPSGHTIRKNTPLAHLVVYLPIDSLKNALKFVAIVKPDLALFVKYEVWPNYLLALEQAAIPTVLFSGIFNPRQIYFKWYGGFMRESLKRFTTLMVQDQESITLLSNIGISQTVLAGDTRIDRVYAMAQAPQALPKEILEIITAFIGAKPCLVGGSIWPEDAAVIGPALTLLKADIKTIIAPHQIGDKPIGELLNNLPKALKENTVVLSNTNPIEVAKAHVLVIDTIGHLNQIYPYAQMAFVGGGFKTGLHNTLEAAAYGIPIGIGPQYNTFKEAVDLVTLQGITVVHDPLGMKAFLNLALNKTYIKKIKNIQSQYLKTQLGSTQKIMETINPFLENSLHP